MTEGNQRWLPFLLPDPLHYRSKLFVIYKHPAGFTRFTAISPFGAKACVSQAHSFILAAAVGVLKSRFPPDRI